MAGSALICLEQRDIAGRELFASKVGLGETGLLTQLTQSLTERCHPVTPKPLPSPERGCSGQICVALGERAVNTALDLSRSVLTASQNPCDTSGAIMLTRTVRVAAPVALMLSLLVSSAVSTPDISPAPYALAVNKCC